MKTEQKNISEGLAAAAAGPTRDKKVRSRVGQVVVEMMLCLPVFLTVIFTIMEMGYIAFFVLLLNHATYECARIGAMLSTPITGGAPRSMASDLQTRVMDRALPGAKVATEIIETLQDPQSRQLNHDLLVRGSYDIKLVFPISSRMFSVPPGSGIRKVEALVRMPIEAPQQQ